MTIHITVCYQGAHGIVTDLGQELQLKGCEPVSGEMKLVIHRYGVWKGARGVVLTTPNLLEAMVCADRDEGGQDNG